MNEKIKKVANTIGSISAIIALAPIALGVEICNGSSKVLHTIFRRS